MVPWVSTIDWPLRLFILLAFPRSACTWTLAQMKALKRTCRLSQLMRGCLWIREEGHLKQKGYSFWCCKAPHLRIKDFSSCVDSRVCKREHPEFPKYNARMEKLQSTSCSKMSCSRHLPTWQIARNDCLLFQHRSQHLEGRRAANRHARLPVALLCS